MMRPGLIARASCVPGFKPPGAHPVIVLRTFQNGNIGVGFITHSTYQYRVSVPMTRSLVPSAFRENGGPLTDEASVLGLIDTQGSERMPKAYPTSATTFTIGTAQVHLTYCIQLPDTEWQNQRTCIHQSLGQV